MRERPILFSPEMSRAIREGRKTETRRVIRPVRGYEHNNVCKPAVELGPKADPGDVWWHSPETDRVGCLQHCPYGDPGDRLRVKEIHYRFGHWEPVAGLMSRSRTGRQRWRFVADNTEVLFDAPEGFRKGRHHLDPGTPEWHKRSSFFLPRWACRTVLEVVERFPQRLQEISEASAEAEGMQFFDGRAVNHHGWRPSRDHGFVYESATLAFSKLWDSINAKRGYPWDSNPWVWVIRFKVVE